MAKDDLEYKIFASEDWDWFVAAKKGEKGKDPMVLYQGHSQEYAYEAILKDLGLEIPIEERDMLTRGTYDPTREDFD